MSAPATRATLASRRLRFLVLSFLLALLAMPGNSSVPPASPPTPDKGTATAAPAPSATPGPASSAAPVPTVSALGSPSYELRLGKVVFERYCQSCHGETGAGDGFNAFNLDPHPRDLSEPAFQKGKTDADLTDAIRRGGSGVGLSPLMPPWGHTLSAQQIDDVVLYLRSLRKPASPS